MVCSSVTDQHGNFILKSFIPTFYENSLKVVENMKKDIGKNFDCHDYMSAITVDILLESAMGYGELRSEQTGFKYEMDVMKMSSILHKRHLKFWLSIERVFQKTKMALDFNEMLNSIMNLTTKKAEYFEKNRRDETIEKISSQATTNEIAILKTDKIEKTHGCNYGTMIRDDLDEDEDFGGKGRLPFLDQLTVNAQKPDINFTEQDVLDQVNTIMFEGHDTTAVGSSFALCLLGIYQEIQNKVIEEIYGIFLGSNRPATFSDTLKMKYLERVILETLRLYPPVPAIARLLKEDVKLSSGDYILPAGIDVLIVQYFLHRRPDCFPNPEIFNPDNFLPEKCQERHYYSYAPFGAEPRSCVEKDFNLQGDIILKINNGFNISLKPRKVKE